MSVSLKKKPSSAVFITPLLLKAIPSTSLKLKGFSREGRITASSPASGTFRKSLTIAG